MSLSVTTNHEDAFCGPILVKLHTADTTDNPMFQKFLGMGVRRNACDLSRPPTMRKPLSSFRRKTESSLCRIFWTPAFAGVTARADRVFLKSPALGVRGKGLFSKKSFPPKSYFHEKGPS